MPGTVIKRWQGASSSAMAAISLDSTWIGWSCQRPSSGPADWAQHPPLASHHKAEIEKWTSMIKAAKIKVE